MDEKKEYFAPMHKAYYSVSLPVSLVDEIRKYLDTDRTYRNVPEFVAEAIRDKLSLRDVGIESYQKQIIALQKTIIDLQTKVLQQ